MNIFCKIWSYKWCLGSLLKSVYFNFHYLPLSQAVYLPILFRKVRFGELKGCVKINYAGGVKCGMIKLGKWGVSIYPDSGFMFENHGGTVIFNGSCIMGAGSAVSVGEKATLVIGDNFTATTTLRLACYKNITFGHDVSFGWECIVMDTDFHKMKKLSDGYTKGYGAINIGECCWVGARCMLLKNTNIPAYTTLSAGTRISSDIKTQGYCIVGNNITTAVLREGLYRNHAENDDIIDYE